MFNPFYLDESAYNPGWYMVRIHVEQLPFTTTVGSLNVLPARLLNLHYADYLRFCRDIVHAEIHGKNKLYPVAYFKLGELSTQFVKLLNARAKYVLWENDNPNFNEHIEALKEFSKKRNLKNS